MVIASNAAPLVLVASDRLRLTPDGKIIDFLDPNVARANAPEEHVRQNYARKLHYDYGYAKDHLVINAPISIGSTTIFADVGVYDSTRSAATRDQAKLRIVVETKAPDKKSGIGQLKSYIFASSAEGGVWVNQTDAPYYLRRVGKGLEEWPNIPREREDWDAIGKHKKQHLRQPYNLVETFKRCHNALYKVGIDSEDLAMDMVRIILAKYRDETNDGETCEFRCTVLEIQSAEGRKRVADRVRDLFAQVRDDNRDVFDEHETVTAGDREVATVVSELQDFRFVPDDASGEVYDIVGAAYEVYVGSYLKGDRGQYFTHRLIVQLLVRMIDPSEHDVILDPAMGSGGFLIAAMRVVTQKILKTDRNARAKRDAIARFHKRIFGIDKSPKLVKVARTNMILASDGHSGLVRGDTLQPLATLSAVFRREAGEEMPTIVLTNPPFGATPEHRITAEKEPEIIAQFQLGHVWRPDDRGDLQPTNSPVGDGCPPEYLFVERCLRWVKPGGRVGIIVPRGVLDNDRALPVRTFMLRNAKVLAVINCHDDTFKPHTDAKTVLLILERKRANDRREDDYAIFMAVSQAIGHNGLGEPIYRTDANGNQILVDGEPVIEHDIDEIHDAWLAHMQGQKTTTKWYFTIKRKDIVADDLTLNPVRYLPQFAESRRRAVELGEREGWRLEHLGQIAQVFGGPRLKRPYAEKGVTEGPSVVRFFTGNAVTQTRGENVKYLDLRRAKAPQIRMIEVMRLRRGMILITRSGTTGRVVYATAYHEGAIGTEDVIRVVVEDEALRGYVYQFLHSKLGQDQLKMNIAGAIVDHIEPSDVKKVVVPVPADLNLVAAIGLPVIKSMHLQEYAFAELEYSRIQLSESLGDDTDAEDAATARRRLKEIEADPNLLITGDELNAELDDLLS